MPDFRDQVDGLASLMEEFRLSEASLTVEGFLVSFRRSISTPTPLSVEPSSDEADSAYLSAQPIAVVEPPKPTGIPISSPMNGIFYGSPSPSAPPFVKVGDTISAGQTVALIEAMKVFNEITSSVSGTVLALVAEPGSIVQPGDVLLYVG